MPQKGKKCAQANSGTHSDRDNYSQILNDQLHGLNSGTIYDESYFYGGEKRPWRDYNYSTEYPKMVILARYLKNSYSPTKVLEIGCAKGFLVKAFVDMGVDAYGLDISEYAIHNSPEKIRSRLTIGSAELLPHQSNTFDLVIAKDLIEHLQDPKKGLLEIYRVLKLRGVAFITTIGPKSIYADIDVTHINVHNLQYWAKIFSDIGFSWKRIPYPFNLIHMEEIPLGPIGKILPRRLRNILLLKINRLRTHLKHSYVLSLTKE